MLKEIVPATKRIAVFMHPENPNGPPQIHSAQAAASSLGIELGPILAVRAPRDLEPAFEEAIRARTNGALRMSDPLVFILRKETAALG